MPEVGDYGVHRTAGLEGQLLVATKKGGGIGGTVYLFFSGIYHCGINNPLAQSIQAVRNG
jgi:hypothetical protein